MSLPRSAATKRNRRRYLLPNHWILTTSRTVNGRFWFSEFDENDRARVLGLLVVAMHRYGVECASFVLMSGHMHALLRSRRGGKRVSLAMQYLLAGVARLVHEKHGTAGPVWQRSFTAVNLLDDEAELNSLAYICQHGVAQGLVSRPQDWPLPNTIDALLGDRRIRGVFPDRVNRAVLRPVEAVLTPLSRWHESSVAYTDVCGRLVHDIISGAQPGLDPAFTRLLDHTFVPPFVSEALGAPLYEMSFAEVYAPPDEVAIA